MSHASKFHHWKDFLGNQGNENSAVNKNNAESTLNLLKAARSGNKAIVLQSLAEGANVNATDDHNCTALYYACKYGYFYMARNLLTFRGADINVGKPPLLTAVRNNHMECFTLLLKFKADVNAVSARGETAFSVACKTNNIIIAEHLLEYGADIFVHSPTTMASILNTQLKNPAFSQLILHCGLKMNLQDIVDSLLDEFDIEINAMYNGRTALSIVAENGNVYLMQKLISLGVDLDGNNSELFSPLSASCKYGNFDAVKCLLDAGAAVDKVDNKGMTSLFYAVNTGRIEITKLLLKRGASVNFSGKNLMMYSYNTNNKIEYSPYCLFSFAESRPIPIYEERNSYIYIYGETILGMACRCGHEKVVELLLAYKADPDLRYDRGVTALSTACEFRHHGIVELLLKNNANPNLCNDLGVSVLAMACVNSDEKTVEILLTFGADPFLQIGDGMSALEGACQNGLENVVELFLKHSACSILTHKQLIIRSQALHIAVKRCYVSIVEMLLDVGADVNFRQAPMFPQSPLWHAVENFFAKQDSSISSDVDGMLSIRLHIIRLLLDFGADTNCFNERGRTLVCVAIEKIVGFQNDPRDTGFWFKLRNVGNITTNDEELTQCTLSRYVQLIELLLNRDALLVCTCLSPSYNNCILSDALIPFDIGQETLIQLFQAGADVKFMSWACSNFRIIMSRPFNEGCLNFFKSLVLDGVKIKKNEFLNFDSNRFGVPREWLLKAWTWYQEQQRNTLSLLQLTRIKIRKQLFIANNSKSILSSIDRLSLPKAMSLYLIFKGDHNEFDLDIQKWIDENDEFKCLAMWQE